MITLTKDQISLKVQQLKAEYGDLCRRSNLSLFSGERLSLRDSAMCTSVRMHLLAKLLDCYGCKHMLEISSFPECLDCIEQSNFKG